jgi:hypothetical protein
MMKAIGEDVKQYVPEETTVDAFALVLDQGYYARGVLERVLLTSMTSQVA